MGAPTPYGSDQGVSAGRNLPESDATARLLLDMPSAGQFAPQALYDPRYAQQQQQSLAALSNEVASGGWSPEERAAYERLNAQAAGTAAGQRAGTAARLAAQGLPAGLANRIAGEVGQQQDTQTGNLMGIAAQQAANDRAYQAAQALAGSAQTAQGQAEGESMFQGGQVARGALSRYLAATGGSYDQLLRSDQQRAQTGQTVGQGIAAGSKLISAFQPSSGDSGGSKPSSWGT